MSAWQNDILKPETSHCRFQIRACVSARYGTPFDLSHYFCLGVGKCHRSKNRRFWRVARNRACQQKERFAYILSIRHRSISFGTTGCTLLCNNYSSKLPLCMNYCAKCKKIAWNVLRVSRNAYLCRRIKQKQHRYHANVSTLLVVAWFSDSIVAKHEAFMCHTERNRKRLVGMRRASFLFNWGNGSKRGSRNGSKPDTLMEVKQDDTIRQAAYQAVILPACWLHFLRESTSLPNWLHPVTLET